MTTIKRDGKCVSVDGGSLTVYFGAVQSALETARDCQVRRPTSTSRPGPPTYRSLPLRRHHHHHHRRRRRCRSSFNSSNCWKDYVLQHAKYPLPKSKTHVYAYYTPASCWDRCWSPFSSIYMDGVVVVVVNETETCCGGRYLKRYR